MNVGGLEPTMPMVNLAFGRSGVVSHVLELAPQINNKHVNDTDASFYRIAELIMESNS